MLRSPANTPLMRAQVILILGALIPTILTTPVGIILLVSDGQGWVGIIAGVLVLSFAASSVTGFIIGGIFLRRGSAMVDVQHDFLSTVSHELRTPMTAMRMFVEALQDDRLTDPGERANCLAVLGQEINRMDGLVDRLIQLSRLESDRSPYTLIPTPVETIVRESMATLETMQALDDTRVEMDIEPDLMVVGDRVALVQVLVNLLSNAWKYSGKDKFIRCRAYGPNDKDIRIEVKDNGPGIPGPEQKRMFDTFWRGDEAAQSGSEGSGLGLAIVKGIVQAHKGKIDVRSATDSGTRMRVTLPRARMPAEKAKA